MLIQILQLLLALSLLIITHEGGHFFFAKLFKTRVEKFYLFFDPWFSLFKIKIGETEYGIGWVPLGGYVKIAGMIDESMDTEQMKQPAQPWEFRSKPAWQRLLIMLGGVMVNFLTGIVIFWLILFHWGESYVPVNEAPFGMQYHEVMHKAGFQDGDNIIAINGTPVETYKDIANTILFEDACEITTVRGADTLNIKMPHEFFRQVLANDVGMLCSVRIPVVVSSVVDGYGAASAGLLAGDSIVSVAGKSTLYYNEFVGELAQHKDTSAAIAFVRNGVADTLDVKIDEAGKIGIIVCDGTRWIEIKTREYGLLEAFPAGIKRGYDFMVSYVKQFRMIFTKEGADKVGGFGTIGNMFPEQWDWLTFWTNTALLAIMLGVANLLPIPALDGGHVLFLLYEIITRRKPSEKFMERAQTIGMILLFALLIYANGNDIIRALSD